VRSGPDFADVVFDIETVDAVGLYREYAVQMQPACSESGGHAPWAGSESTARAFLASGEVKGYRLSSSIGLDGAIWARHLSITMG
jgi:hypothetical protein